MVSRVEMAYIARRHDTTMSRAMLRALGLSPRRRTGHGHGRDVERLVYGGMRWCFANHGSPMHLSP